MTARYWLLTLIVVLIGAAGAVATFGPLPTGSQPGISGEPLVQHRGGVAFAAQAEQPPVGEQPLQAQPPPNTHDGGALMPPAAGDAASPTEQPVRKPAAEMTDEEKLAALEEWKNADPRELIEAKYADLQSRKTTPMVEESEDFIPDTGRIDPLTRVRGEVPDELKPPRAGESDVNDIDSYIDTRSASLIVDGVGMSTQVWNVFQIGLQKIVTISVQGQFYEMTGVGDGFQFMAWGERSPIQVNYSLISASPDEVVVGVSATPLGTTIVINKTFTFIPQ